jgi:hypothetical protein
MMESKAITHRLKREREEKQLRREAYVLQTAEIERAKKAEQAHLLEELVCNNRLIHVACVLNLSI